jgi:hypothetical protein
MENFILLILELTDANVIAREQFYLDTYSPEYNILKFADSSKGHKFSLESRSKMSIAKKGENNPFFSKKHSKEAIAIMKDYASNRSFSHRKGYPVVVIDTLNDTKHEFTSVNLAAKFLNINSSSLFSRVRKGTKSLYKGRYDIIVDRS